MYEWLLDYQKLQDEITYTEYKLDRSKRELKRWEEGDLFKVKLHPESIASNLEEYIFSYEYELANKMNDSDNAENLISSFTGLENKILYYRYIKGMTLVEVAVELQYSYNYIKSKHAEIMRIIKYADKIST